MAKSILSRLCEAKEIYTCHYDNADKICWLDDKTDDDLPVEQVWTLYFTGLIKHDLTVMSHRSMQKFFPPKMEAVVSAANEAKRLLAILPKKIKTLKSLEKFCEENDIDIQYTTVKPRVCYWAAKPDDYLAVKMNGIVLVYGSHSVLKSGILHKRLEDLYSIVEEHNLCKKGGHNEKAI